MKNKFILLIFFSTIMFHCSFSQPTNIKISSGIFFDGEPQMAVNPANPKNIVTAWMSLKYTNGFHVAIVSRATFDGGNTWSNSLYTFPHFSPTFGSADVTMCFHRNGTLYLAYIDYKKPDSGGVYITKSVDGGLSFTTPKKIIDANESKKIPLDRPWMAIDNSGGVNDGYIYITTKPAPWIPAPNRPYIKYSNDSGNTFSNFIFIDSTNYFVGKYIQAPMASLCVTKSGKLVTAYPSVDSGGFIIPKYIAASTYKIQNGFNYNTIIRKNFTPGDTNLKLGTRMCANPNDSNQLAIAGVFNFNGSADIYILSSNDGGKTWNAETLVNDDNTNTSQDLVWADYDEKGKIVCLWRDRRNSGISGSKTSYDFYAATSSDNGKTFSKNIRMSDMSVAYDSIIINDGNDFLSCAAHNDTLYAVWADTRSNKLAVYFSKINITSGTGIVPVLLSEKHIVNIYPNPVNERIFINLGNDISLPCKISITDITGKIVYKNLLYYRSAEVNTATLSKGIYFINVSSESFSETKKIVKE